MKAILSLACIMLPVASLHGREEAAPDPAQAHREGAARLSQEQDELSADVQQLVLEQTIPQVIELLEEVEEIMDETTDRLDGHDTGGETIAAQTEIIEKIHAAAKQRQNQNGSGKSGSAMMDMMERMMGKQPQGDGKKNAKGGQSGEQPGDGATGLSDTANDNARASGDGKTTERRVPKAAGSAGPDLPEEFRKAFDAYNRGAEQKIK